MLAKPTRGSLTRVRSSSLSSAVINSPSFSCLCGFDILRSWFDALLVIRLDNITDLKFVEVFEDDTAFVAAGDLAHIVFAAPQRGDFAVKDALFLAHHACPRGAGDFAIS